MTRAIVIAIVMLVQSAHAEPKTKSPYVLCIERGFDQCNAAKVKAAKRQLKRSKQRPRHVTRHDARRQQCAAYVSRARKRVYKRHGIVTQAMHQSCPIASPDVAYQRCLTRMQNRCVRKHSK